MIELRCDFKFHGALDEDAGILEVKCRSRRCGAVPGVVVVLHRFKMSTGDLIETVKFRDPGEGTQ